SAVVVCITGVPSVAFGTDADLEIFEGNQFNKKMLPQSRRQFDEPISHALAQNDVDKVIKLSRQAAKQWTSCQWKSRWGRQTRRAKIVSYLMLAAANLATLGRFDEAIECYTQCNNVAEQDGLGQYCYLPLVAQVYSQSKQFSKAEEIYKSIITAGQNTSEMTVALSRVYEESGNLNIAQETLEKSLIANPRNRLLLIALKDNLTKQNKTQSINKIDQILSDKHCPCCLSDAEVIPISYGLPSFPVKEHVHLGGCVYSAGAPQWWCEKDKVGF
ncbi:MAG: hypothetical protein K2X81_26730, partial [Candidatus Obscuribacterales bacterium]|nr:hypothetical protein [Candidatus Obscuribacterales bacterium]